MKRKTLFNSGWEFALTDNGSSLTNTGKLSYAPVDIPHDWLIYDTEELYRSGDGWYRKKFDVSDINSHEYILYFDGVYMNSTVYINGAEVFTQTSGYASFQVNISSYVNVGENTVDVCVRYTSPNSRWYSGAGIFRNVWLYTLSTVHLNIDGTYISANAETGDVYICSEISGTVASMPDMKLRHTVLDENGSAAAHREIDVKWNTCECTVHADSFKLWSLEERNLYTLRTELVIASDGNVLDTEDNIFGFRSIKFDPDNGFFLNGKNMKLKGVCLHHDLGCLGSAFNLSALERQLRIMKEMGVNSIRTSHNPPAPELMELCDKMGFLVDSEAFDMWEKPKTEFDNARFFDMTSHRDVMSWVKRDRNHPSVIMWSIGNEIYDTHADDHGYEIAENLKNYVRQYDHKKNAAVTIASNYIEWERAQKIGEMLGVSGYNYTERCYDDHHKKYPNTVIYGSETSSAVRSRGIYHFPADLPQLTCEDMQCSSLANSTVIWGKPAEEAWIMDRDRKFVCGQYIWTGFDYIGEPTPYSTKNSYFGAVDTAGLPKDIYYFYKSVWTDEPMIHLLPYWDHNDGQLIDVIAYTNGASCELFVNGVSKGVQYIDREKGDVLHGLWIVPYEAGEITAKAYDESGREIAADTKHSFGDPVSVSLRAERQEISADGKDIVFVVISVRDKDGYEVENARNRVTVFVEGAGVLAGMDNGDSTDYENYKTNSRLLFSGKAVAAVRSLKEEGNITVKAVSEGLSSGEITITTVPAEADDGVSCLQYVECTENTDKNIPVRAIKACADVQSLGKDKADAVITYKLFPENATYDNISCRAVKSGGAVSPIAEVSEENGSVKVKALGDGDFTVRLTCKNGGKYPQVISDVNFTCSGLGTAVRDPYAMVTADSLTRSSERVNYIGNNAVSGFEGSGYAVYENFDFGRAGTDKIVLYMGHNLVNSIPVTVTAGDLVQELSFPDNGLWNAFAPMEFALDKTVRGINDIRIDINGGLTFGGFEFVKNEEAVSEIFAADCNEIYGDDYTVSGSRITGIGNNVVLSFGHIDFGTGVSRIAVCGRTENEVNTIQLRTVKDGVQKTQLLEFKKSEDYSVQLFDTENIEGTVDVSFVFLPGCKFDFESFRFER